MTKRISFKQEKINDWLNTPELLYLHSTWGLNHIGVMQGQLKSSAKIWPIFYPLCILLHLSFTPSTMCHINALTDLKSSMLITTSNSWDTSDYFLIINKQIEVKKSGKAEIWTLTYVDQKLSDQHTYTITLQTHN